MICHKCNKEIDDDSIYCQWCGVVVCKDKKTKKKNKCSIIVLISGLIVLFLGGGVFAWYFNFSPKGKYLHANKALENGNYSLAVKYYSEAGDYEDAIQKAKQAESAFHYYKGIELIEESRYSEAKEEFEASDEYEDSKEKIKECDYNIGLIYTSEGKFLDAADQFKLSSDYMDSNEQIIMLGNQLVDLGNYADAISVYKCAKNWGMEPKAQYARGMIALETNNYYEAALLFSNAGDVLDAAEQYNNAQYNYAKKELESGQYDTAISEFEKVSDYSDSSDMIYACKLMIANENYKAGNLNSAEEKLKGLPSDFSYKNIKVSTLNNQLEKNSDWVTICGEWLNTSGKAETSCHARNYYYDAGSWTSTFEAGDYALDVRCILNSDGTVTVKGNAHFLVFTNWSTIQAGLKYDQFYSVAFNKRLSASNFGVEVSVDDYTTITFDKKKITLKYVFNDNNYSTSFINKYETNVTYGKIKSY